jgi:ferritin-like metal-binding protein YciE
MADQRRRGRGRSGKGGRIPRKGDQPQAQSASDESFVSFPLEITGPIRVPSPLDEKAVEALLRDTLQRERRQVAALESAIAAGGDGTLQDIRAQVERHRDQLEQLARDLGADVSGGGEEAGSDRPAELVAEQRLARLGWLGLQRVAYASGDRRVDRVVKPVLREKERHAEVLESHAVRSRLLELYPYQD